MKCDGCTLCCKLLNIDWMDSPAGELCKECDEGKGCKIFDHAPEGCLNFECAYRQMRKASPMLRPDNCDVIFEMISNTIMIGTVDPEIKRLKPVVNGQIDSFLNEGLSVVLFNQKISEPLIYNTPDRTKKNVWNEVEDKMEKIK